MARKGTRRNPFERAVDVDVRLCAGLDWILADDGGAEMGGPASTEDAAMASLGAVERRLCLHWTRINAEVGGGPQCADGGAAAELKGVEEASLPWIERAWRASPNGGGGGGDNNLAVSCDASMLQALECISKCPVFDPELSCPTADKPCPRTRPGMSLLDVAPVGHEGLVEVSAARGARRGIFSHAKDWGGGQRRVDGGGLARGAGGGDPKSVLPL